MKWLKNIYLTFDWKSSSAATTTKKEKQTFLYRCTEHESFSIFYAIFQIPIYILTHFRDSLEKNLDNILHFFKMRLQEGFGPIIPCFEY